MIVVMVQVQVVPTGVEQFVEATRINAEASLLEPGIARFDVIQEQGAPTQFVLVEVYRDEHAPVAHKQTEHYKAWRQTVEPLMAQPRSSRRFNPLVPADAGWETSGV